MKRNQWTIPEETIKEVQCQFCNETGDVEWSNQHLKGKPYATAGNQFLVTKTK